VIRGYLISKMLKEGKKPWWTEPPFKMDEDVEAAYLELFISL
jgi:hypothetical protein